MRKCLFSVLLFVLLAVAAEAQERLTEHTYALPPNLVQPQVGIEEMRWLNGRWLGTGMGGVVEEIWSPPRAGTMMATFRILLEGEPFVYELCLLTEERGSLVYKVKHFSSDLRAWESKTEYVSFPLIRIEGDTYYFGGMTLKREPYRITYYLAVKDSEGVYREEVFELENRPLR